MLWIGPNREIVGSGGDVSNETLADVGDLCLAARMSLYIVDEARFSVNASDGALAIADVGWIDRGEYECILLGTGDGDSEEELVR